jgi:hypothetical protein
MSPQISKVFLLLYLRLFSGLKSQVKNKFGDLMSCVLSLDVRVGEAQVLVFYLYSQSTALPLLPFIFAFLLKSKVKSKVRSLIPLELSLFSPLFHISMSKN